MAQQVIQDISDKCEAIRKQVDFIYSRAGIGKADWEQYDTNYVSLRAVLKAAAADLITLAQELEALIP